jgi:hypothetical protein
MMRCAPLGSGADVREGVVVSVKNLLGDRPPLSIFKLTGACAQSASRKEQTTDRKENKDSKLLSTGLI